jgi:phytanoyl-CoA hydroxylase
VGEPGDALAALLRDGYAVVRGGVEDRLCVAANTDVDVFKARNRRDVAPNLDGQGRLHRVVDIHAVIDSFAALFSENEALEVCDQFFAAETALYTSLFFECGSEQALHRDSPAFCTRPEGRYLGLWVALEDTGADNGPLVVVPGSHALPVVDVEAMAIELYGDPSKAPRSDDAGWHTYQAAVGALADAHGLSAREVHVRRGDVVIWHPLLFHGGAPRRSSTRTRRSIVFHVTPLGTSVHGQDFFFDRAKEAADWPHSRYARRNGRAILKHTTIDFAHEYSKAVRLLRRPGAGMGERLRTTMRIARTRLGQRHHSGTG